MTQLGVSRFGNPISKILNVFLIIHEDFLCRDSV